MLAFLPATVAQGNGSGINDPQGDVVTTNAQGPTTPYPADVASGADLTHVALFSENDKIVTDMSFAGDAAKVPPNTLRGYSITMRHGTSQYMISNDGSPCARIAHFKDGAWEDLECAEEEVRLAGQGITVRTPFTALVNETHIPLQPGSLVEDIVFQGQVILPGLETPRTPTIVIGRDLAPDSGFLDAFKVPTPTGAGPVFISIANPLRVSNGEATTLVFQVDLTNRGTTTATTLLEAKSSVASMTPRITGRVSVPASESVRVPLIVTTSFAHAHGATNYVDIIATYDDGTEMDRAQASVYYLAVPQPSGHHPSIYFHGQNPQTNPADSGPLNQQQEVWFSTESVDDLASAKEAVSISGDIQTHRFDWWFPLKPELQLGLDVKATGAPFHATFVSDIPLQGAMATAELHYCPPGATTRNACLASNAAKTMLTGESTAVDMTAGTPTTFNFEWKTLGQDLFEPFQLGNNLAVVMHLTTTNPSYLGEDFGDPVRVQLGETTADLPLNEYRDPVEKNFLSSEAISIQAKTAADRNVNAGRTYVYEFNVQNNGTSSVKLASEIVGREADWATIQSGPSAIIGAGESRTLQVVVRPPSDAVAGQAADLVLVVEDSNHPDMAVLARFSATVVDEDVPDESSMVSASGHESPLSASVVFLALGALLLAARRSRS